MARTRFSGGGTRQRIANVESYPTMRKREAEYRANALQACAARSNG
jgi:hypothetical protein